MKILTILCVITSVLITGCSSEELITNDQEVVNLELKTESNRSGAPERISLTGNPDFSVHARKRSNGVVSGFWRDNQTGIKVNIECIAFFEDNMGQNAILTGTVIRGPQAGVQFVVRLLDGQTDGVSSRIPMNLDCNNVNPQFLFPFPIGSGNVKID